MRFISDVFLMFNMSKMLILVVFVMYLFKYFYSSRMLMLTLLLFVISAVSSASAPRVFLRAVIIIFDSDRGDICVFIDKKVVIDLWGLIYAGLISWSSVCVMNSCLQKLKRLNNVCVLNRKTQDSHTHCIS